MKKEVLGEMTLRKEYKYKYSTYVLASILKMCCCCNKMHCIRLRTEQLESYKKNISRMENELDIVQYVSALRLSTFVSRMKLTTYQRYFINKFRAYHISSNEKENELITTLDKEEDDLIEAGYTDQLRDMNKVEQMVNQLNLQSAVDRKIILSLTGIQSQDSLRNNTTAYHSLG